MRYLRLFCGVLCAAVLSLAACSTQTMANELDMRAGAMTQLYSSVAQGQQSKATLQQKAGELAASICEAVYPPLSPQECQLRVMKARSTRSKCNLPAIARSTTSSFKCASESSHNVYAIRYQQRCRRTNVSRRSCIRSAVRSMRIHRTWTPTKHTGCFTVSNRSPG